MLATKRAKMDNVSNYQLLDLPAEILLKILLYLDCVYDKIRCGQVCKRLRAIRSEKLFWKNTIIFRKKLKPDFLQCILDGGCKYLSLRACVLKGSLKLTKTYQLKHLDLGECEGDKVARELIASCNSLEKLSLPKLSGSLIDYEFNLNLISKSVGSQNGKTLKVLEMGQQIWFSRLRSEVVHHIVDYCNELTELCIIFCLDEDSIDYCVNHLSPKLEKLSFEFEKHIRDDHFLILVTRCNKLKELNFARTSITDSSVLNIKRHLWSTLEKLDVSYSEIKFSTLIQLKSMPKLKVLRCKHLSSDEIEKLKKEIPHASINEEDFNIACPWQMIEQDEVSKAYPDQRVQSFNGRSWQFLW